MRKGRLTLVVVALLGAWSSTGTAYAATLPVPVDPMLTVQLTGDATTSPCWVPCRVQASTPGSTAGYQLSWWIYEQRSIDEQNDAVPEQSGTIPEPPVPWSGIVAPVLDVAVTQPGSYVLVVVGDRPDGRPVLAPDRPRVEVVRHPLDVAAPAPALIRTDATGRGRLVRVPGTVAIRSSKSHLVVEVRRNARWIALRAQRCARDRAGARCFGLRRAGAWPAASLRSLRLRLTDWEKDPSSASQRVIEAPLANKSIAGGPRNTG